ncbi:hypothetical protein FKM82_019001 [Ascaphus truei]
MCLHAARFPGYIFRATSNSGPWIDRHHLTTLSLQKKPLETHTTAIPARWHSWKGKNTSNTLSSHNYRSCIYNTGPTS